MLDRHCRDRDYIALPKARITITTAQTKVLKGRKRDILTNVGNQTAVNQVLITDFHCIDKNYTLNTEIFDC